MNDDQEQKTDASQVAEGILDEAREEAEKLRAEWQESRRSREASLKKRVANLESETDERIERERTRILERADARVALEQRRSRLQLQNALHQEIEKEALTAAHDLIGSAGYPQMVLGWLVEAGVGLGSPQAIVNCSAEERDVVAKQLPGAGERISARLGGEVTLTMSEEPPLSEQGIVMTAADGQTGFSNRLVDRLHRRRNAVRRIVHDTLFGEE